MPIKKLKMVEANITLSRSVSSRPLLQFLEALLLGKAAQAPWFIGKHFKSLHYEEGGVPAWISFSMFVVNIERYSLFAYLNGADYYTKLQSIVFAY